MNSAIIITLVALLLLSVYQIIGLSKKLATATQEVSELKIDPVTGLYRRSSRSDYEIQAHIKEAARNKWHCVVMSIDADGLKKINDSLGHKAGDQMLRKIANTMKSCLRPYDLIYRWGGDEFVIVFSFKPDGYDPVSIANEIINRIKKNLTEQSLSVSIGLSFVRECDFEKAFSVADIAMYEEKLINR